MGVKQVISSLDAPGSMMKDVEDNAKEPEWWSKQVDDLSQTKIFQSAETTQSHLDATRKEMFDTLSAFHSQVRGITYSAGAILALSVATFAFALEKSSIEPQVQKYMLLFAAGLLLTTVPLGWVAIRNMKERYRSYVSAVVYAAQTHAAAGILSHPWLEWIYSYLRTSKLENNNDLVEYWIKMPPNSFISYRRTIIVVQIMAVFGALFVIRIAFC